MDDFPFWVVTARSMQYAWGGNVAIQIAREVSDNVGGHAGVVMNRGRAEALGLGDGDRVEVRSPVNATRGVLVTREGIRPDTLLMVGQFDHWATPYAKDMARPSMNALVPMLLDLTDSTGSGADIARASVRKL
jgi:phenylacetyl-CoA:acceptor oxidoreductase